uniref:Uncharacterized protein n=1 Tax=Lepeophtheirus salmonis TaxID=72036 RepID=A0A0K2U282_LEPSM
MKNISFTKVLQFLRCI